MIRLIFTLCLLALAAGPAMADAIDDARAALVAQNNNDLDEAIRLYTQAIDSHELNSRFLAIAHYNRGNIHFAGRNYLGAIVDYETATVLKPGYAQAYNNQGNAYIALDLYEKAISAFDQAVHIKADYALAFKNRGNAHTVMGAFDSAIADYDLAIIFDPDLAKAYNNRANAKYFLARYAAAIDDYEAALEIDPFDIYSMIWRYLAAIGNNDAAAQKALRSRIYDVDPGRWPAVVARHYLGRATAEEVRVEIAAAATPAERLERRCEAYFYLGAQALIDGDTKAAARLFKDAVATDVRRFVEYIGATVNLDRLAQ